MAGIRNGVREVVGERRVGDLVRAAIDTERSVRRDEGCREGDDGKTERGGQRQVRHGRMVGDRRSKVRVFPREIRADQLRTRRIDRERGAPIVEEHDRLKPERLVDRGKCRCTRRRAAELLGCGQILCLQEVGHVGGGESRCDVCPNLKRRLLVVPPLCLRGGERDGNARDGDHGEGRDTRALCPKATHGRIVRAVPVPPVTDCHRIGYGDAGRCPSIAQPTGSDDGPAFARGVMRRLFSPRELFRHRGNRFHRPPTPAAPDGER